MLSCLILSIFLFFWFKNILQSNWNSVLVLFLQKIPILNWVLLWGGVYVYVALVYRVEFGFFCADLFIIYWILWMNVFE